MLFNSLYFIGYTLVVFIVYMRLRFRGQNIFLLIASYIFYGWWDWRFTILLLISTIVDFFVGKKICSTKAQNSKKILLFISVFVNLGILAFFKYYNFFIESTAFALSSIGFEPHLPILKILLPIGISFYTFKTLTYTIDVYRGKIEPTRNFIDYALFVSFFPQILAGPIDRASNLLPQFSKPRSVTRLMVMQGLTLILVGYFKKVAIADSLAPIVSNFFEAPGTMTSGQLWSGVYAYTFQIYGDFSGYTDIARGISLILGFKTMENFNTPYLSRSVTEFWKRWHISLSSWFMDYLYIPIGGNRYGNTRTYINLFVTMTVCGLWHGAAWTFILWGFIHGLLLAGHRVVLGGKKADVSWPHNFSGWMANILKIVITFHVIALAWVLFRATSLDNALTYYAGLFCFNQYTGFSMTVLFAGVLLFLLDILQTWSGSETWLIEFKGGQVIRYTVVQTLLLSVIAAAIAHSGTNVPFIYFQF